MRKENALLKEKVNNLEQYTRRNSIRVHGIPEESDKENCEDIVLNFFKEQMNMDIPLADIDRTHRVGKVTPEKRITRQSGKTLPRAIIVKFVSYRTRRLVFSKKKDLKGSRHTIRNSKN